MSSRLLHGLSEREKQVKPVDQVTNYYPKPLYLANLLKEERDAGCIIDDEAESQSEEASQKAPSPEPCRLLGLPKRVSAPTVSVAPNNSTGSLTKPRSSSIGSVKPVASSMRAASGTTVRSHMSAADHTEQPVRRADPVRSRREERELAKTMEELDEQLRVTRQKEIQLTAKELPQLVTWCRDLEQDFHTSSTAEEREDAIDFVRSSIPQLIQEAQLERA